MHQIREVVASRNATWVFRILFGIAAVLLVWDAARSVGVLQAYDVQFGTKFWFANVIVIVSSTVGVLCIWMMGRGWEWAVWVWAVSAIGVALTGILISLNVTLFAQRYVVLPWIALFVSAMMKSRFATPWKKGGASWIITGVAFFLICFAMGVRSIHQNVMAERSLFLDPLQESIAAKNQQLPMMVTDELRLDRIAIERSVYHQYLTFPEYTVSELDTDPGLELVRDYYAEAFMLQICDVPQCRQNVAEGMSCDGIFQYNLVDMYGEQVVSFSLDGSDCR